MKLLGFGLPPTNLKVLFSLSSMDNFSASFVFPVLQMEPANEPGAVYGRRTLCPVFSRRSVQYGADCRKGLQLHITHSALFSRYTVGNGICLSSEQGKLFANQSEHAGLTVGFTSSVFVFCVHVTSTSFCHSNEEGILSSLALSLLHASGPTC